jgi:periplasmic protein TonB
MAFQSPESRSANATFAPPNSPEPLSQTGQLIGWGIYGTLLVVGFGFGIVTGYERPRTSSIAKVSKEKDENKLDVAKSEPSKPSPKTNPTPEPPVKETSPPKPMESVTAQDDPKPPMPMATTPPKDDPKPPMPMATTLPKDDPKPPLKKENLKPVSFKTDVLPVLRTHCLNCHGAAGKARGDVDLTSFAKLTKSPSANNKMLVPGKPDESDLYTSITERDMPQNKPKPSEKELLILKNWIVTGAKERHRVGRGRRRRIPTLLGVHLISLVPMGEFR